MKKVVLALCVFLSFAGFLYAEQKAQKFLVIQCSNAAVIGLKIPMTCMGDGIKDKIETTFETLYHSGWKIDTQISGTSGFMFFLIKQK